MESADNRSGNQGRPGTPRETVLSGVIRHRSSLFAFILSAVRDVHRAEDVLQETCLTICAKAEEFRAGSEFLPWARGIAVFKIREHWRDRRLTHRCVPPESLESLARAWDATDSASTAPPEDRREALHDCLKRLPERALRAVVSFYEDGESCDRIAERSRTSVPAIHMLLRRARERLYDCIRRKLRLAERGAEA